MNELKKICDDVLNRMRDEEVNSCIAWAGGTANDFLNNKEPYDYDLMVYGLPYEKIEQVFRDVVDIIHTNPKAGVLRAMAPSGKQIDVYLATRTSYSKELNAWKWDKEYYNFLINKNVHHKNVVNHILNSKVPRFSNNCIYIHYPTMDVVTKSKWHVDFKNKRCSHLKEQSRYVLIDYITLFKYASNGYVIDEKTKELFVDDSLIPYMTWSDKFLEENIISVYQDIFLRNLKGLYGYEERSKKFDPTVFYDLCKRSKLISSLFYKDPNKNPTDLSSKEKFLLNIYDNDLNLLENDVGNKFIVDKKFELNVSGC